MNEINPTDLRKLADIRMVFLDMDGTIYHGARLFPTTLPFLAYLDSRGVKYAFCTNNSSRSKSEYIAKLAKMGIASTEENFYTSIDFLVDTLRENYPQIQRLFLLGVPTMAEELRKNGFVITAIDEVPDAVVVSFDQTLTYDRLCRAAYLVSQGVPGFSTHPDVFCPTPEPTVLVDCGAISRCIELATDKKLIQLGKPLRGFLRCAAAKHAVPIERCLMVGDRLATDIAAGINAGCVTCRIDGPGADLTPVADVTPDFNCHDLGELQKLMQQAQGVENR